MNAHLLQALRACAPLRPQTLESQPGIRVAAAGEAEPLRHFPWVYGAALGALVLEWIARRRRGMR